MNQKNGHNMVTVQEMDILKADLNLLTIYARVVETGSFSEAARRHGSSRSVVSKSIAKLEKSLGARLLNRTTRHLSLTEIGQVVAAHATRILEELEQLEQTVGSFNDEPRGTLRVSASVAFGTLHVAPALADFLAAHPKLSMELTITDRPIDLAGEGYDMEIRVTAEPPLTVVARKLAPVKRKLCGTQSYFEKNGSFKKRVG